MHARACSYDLSTIQNTDWWVVGQVGGQSIAIHDNAALHCNGLAPAFHSWSSLEQLAALSNNSTNCQFFAGPTTHSESIHLTQISDIDRGDSDIDRRMIRFKCAVVATLSLLFLALEAAMQHLPFTPPITQQMVRSPEADEMRKKLAEISSDIPFVSSPSIEE